MYNLLLSVMFNKLRESNPIDTFFVNQMIFISPQQESTHNIVRNQDLYIGWTLLSNLIRLYQVLTVDTTP